MAKRRYRRRRKMKGTVAQKALKLAVANARKIKKDVEVKNTIRSVTTGTSFDYNGTVLDLNSSLAQGLAVTNDRIGDKVYYKNLSLNLMLSTTSTCAVRCIILRAREEQGSAPTIGTLLSGNTGIYTVSCKSWQYRFETKFLYDKTFTFSSGTAVNKALKLKIPLNHMVQFEQGASTVQSGGIYMLLVSDTSASNPIYKYQSQITYTDA